jgi:hypothetical protein
MRRRSGETIEIRRQIATLSGIQPIFGPLCYDFLCSMNTVMVFALV